MSDYLNFLEREFAQDPLPTLELSQIRSDPDGPAAVPWTKYASFTIPRSRGRLGLGLTAGDLARAAARLQGIPRFSRSARAVKRVADIAFSSVALILLAPTMFAIALAIRLDSPGPVLYAQQRVGQHGRLFLMYKFRTVSTADKEPLAGLADGVNEQGLLFKTKFDPRFTQVGAFIRRYSLDELPMLLNVLNGSMSLVGPRAQFPREAARYSHRGHNYHLLMRPGVTGLWQTAGARSVSYGWDDLLKLDLYYVENWSLFDDLVIFLWTVRTALARSS